VYHYTFYISLFPRFIVKRHYYTYSYTFTDRWIKRELLPARKVRTHRLLACVFRAEVILDRIRSQVAGSIADHGWMLWIFMVTDYSCYCVTSSFTRYTLWGWKITRKIKVIVLSNTYCTWLLSGTDKSQSLGE